jgi:multicomponent Na+:H+ antiporter subunit B
MKDKQKSSFVNRNRKSIVMIVCIIMCLITLSSFMLFGSSNYDGKDDAKAYVLENHNTETGAKNAVTAIYLNYRLWDTIFEAMLLLLSAMAVIYFSWSLDHEE